MKSLGIIFISIGVAIFLFILFSFLKGKDDVISPIPDQKGVKVIFITPAK